MNSFEEQAKGMNSTEILNLYRNFYFREPNHTEQGLVAWAINDILPKYIKMQQWAKQMELPCGIGDTIYYLNTLWDMNNQRPQVEIVQASVDGVVIEDDIMQVYTYSNPVGAEKVSFNIDAFNERFFTDYNKAEAKYLEKADNIRQKYEKVDMERE